MRVKNQVLTFQLKNYYLKISTIFILNLQKYDPYWDVPDDVPEVPENLDHLINLLVLTLNYLGFKFHNDMTNTLDTTYCCLSLPPKSNFWRFKTTVGGMLTSTIKAVLSSRLSMIMIHNHGVH